MPLKQSNAHKSLLYILVKNPFTTRDFERMGVEPLEKKFEVRVLDCTSWLMPQALITRGNSTLALPNIISITSIRQLVAEIKGRSGGIAVDYVGQFSIKAMLLFSLLKKNGFKLVVMDSGAYPLPEVEKQKIFSGEKLVYIFKNNLLQRVINSFSHKIFLKLLPDQTPDFALVSGTSWMSYRRFTSAKKKIPAHSWDYEKYLRIKDKLLTINSDYAVYLDENIAEHEDNAELGHPAPVTKKNFLSSLNKFFTQFEMVTGMPVVVAGYPTDQPSVRANNFDARKVIFGETAELIGNAKIVFAHASTAISFAVLWQKPIVFLTSNEMSKSWYQPWIEAPRNVLNSVVINIDSQSTDYEDISAWQKVDQNAYLDYERTYIKSESSPDISLWTIFQSMSSSEVEDNQCTH